MRFDNIDPATDTVQSMIPGSSFSFSAVKMDKLTSAEYTLVTIAMDCSGSISPYQGDLVDMLNSIVGACKKNPKAENLLVRVITFNDSLTEVHGFVPITSLSTYTAHDLQVGGMTALYDALYSAVTATKIFGENLVDQDYDVNAVIYVTTDGDDNMSTFSPSKIASEIDNILRSEKLDSISTILVRMGSSNSLDDLQKEAKISQVINMGDITSQKLAKLAGWVSKSVSSSSQALGTNAPAAVPSLTI